MPRLFEALEIRNRRAVSASIMRWDGQVFAAMKPTLAITGALAFAMLFAGCKPQSNEVKPEPVARSLPADERSGHFDRVNAHLELGGVLYGYADIDGDILSVAPSLRTLADAIGEQQPMIAPFLKQDFAQIMIDLGLNDVRAVGLSSVAAKEGGYRNRVYLHTPEGRRGLLAGLGGEASEFAQVRLAPADADIYAESDIDAAALYAAVRALVVRVAGEPMADVVESQLKTDASGLGVTPLAVIQSIKGRATLVVRTDPERTFTIPGAQPLTMPAFQFIVRMDGLGASLEPALAKLPVFTASQEGQLKLYVPKDSSPIQGLQPLLAVEGGALYLASDVEFLRASLARTEGLGQVPAFRETLATLGEKGNGLTYISPRLFAQLRRIKELNPDMPAEAVQGMDFILASLPESTQPLMAVRINLPDGILYRARWHRSLKQDIAMIGVYNPVTVGLLASMAIPAFQKVRASSQEKAIINNLRQLDLAAQQHALESGKEVSYYNELVGTGRDRYIRTLKPVAGEDYTKLVIRSSDTEISVTTRDGKVVTHTR
jgi:type IV pilus assembly protein PilA